MTNDETENEWGDPPLEGEVQQRPSPTVYPNITWVLCVGATVVLAISGDVSNAIKTLALALIAASMVGILQVVDDV